MSTCEFVVGTDESGKRMDQFLALRLSSKASRSEIQRLIRSGTVLLNDVAVRKGSTILKAHDCLRLPWEEKKPPLIQPEIRPLHIIFEDEDLLVVDKPAGMVVHPSPGHREGTLVNVLMGSGRRLSDCAGFERPGIVHRLDKETSGLLMIAKNNRSHRNLVRLFQEREVKKGYLALVWGRVDFEEGVIDEPIGRHPAHPKKMSIRRDETGKPAVTEYRVLERFRFSSFLKIRTRTGRTHQIRVHFCFAGHPLVGDRLYGKKDSAERLGLHASEIEAPHPSSRQMLRFESPLPDDFARMLNSERRR